MSDEKIKNDCPTRLKKHLDITFSKLDKDSWDAVYCIVGDEGVSKSNLALHMIDYWYRMKNGVVTEEEAKHMCLDPIQFVSDLKDLKRVEATCFDEAGDIDSRRSMSDFNTKLRIAYQVIRGRNLLSLLVLPSLWDLDKFFRNRRIRGLFVVYKRGSFAYWDKEKLRKMMAINENREIKYYNSVNPTYRGTFPKYKGVLLEPYLKKKQKKMDEALNELHSKLTAKDVPQEEKPLTQLQKRHVMQRDKMALLINEKLGWTFEDIGRYIGIDGSGLGRSSKKTVALSASDE